MNHLIRAALDLVCADAESSGVPGPPYVDGDWEFYDDLTVGGPDLVVTVADRVQDDIVENLQPESATNWPPCPAHPRTHPMRPAVVNGEAVWICTNGTPYAPIGSLAGSRHRSRRLAKRQK